MSGPILMPLIGGALIGLSASLLLLAAGRIAGISGIVGGLGTSTGPDTRWRLAFLLGLLGGGAALALMAPGLIAAPVGRPLLALVVAGGLVGVGTRVGLGWWCGGARRTWAG